MSAAAEFDVAPVSATGTRIHAGQLATAAFIVVVGCTLAWGASRFPVDKGYTILGPQVYPYAVAVFLLFVGTGLACQALMGGFPGIAAEVPTTRAGVVGAAWVSSGLSVVALLITHIGFVLAAAALFVMAARGFGSRRPMRDMAVGVALTLPVYWAFSIGLGVSLPSLLNAWI